MKALYISALSSKALIDKIHNKTKENPGFAVQKFSRLIVSGLISNGVDVTALTCPPIVKKYTRKIFVNLTNETENGIKYRYMPFLNIPLLRNICIFLYSFFYVLLWGLKNKDKKVIICDVLCISSSIGTLLASKIVRLRSVGVVTDIYSQMVGIPTSGMKKYLSKLAGIINSKYISSFTHYVLLTEAMNELVNPNNRPYIVMEALCDSSLSSDFTKVDKEYPRTVIYAGGIEEKYGLKMLVDAFIKINRDDVHLYIYGSGTYVEPLKKITEQYRTIIYKGICPNEEIVDSEMRASLLINPRFSTEEFTKYSFPSKNMEYMVSGTPLLTTKLPGMPEEYHQYVYLFEDETIEGYYNKICEVLSKSTEELDSIGYNARRFVLEHKNNIVQAERIISLLSYK